MKKIGILKDWLKKEERVVVAFSGGIDSTLLVAVASEVLKDNMIAVTGDSPSLPTSDRKFVTNFCKRKNISHRFILTSEFEIDEFRSNPINRCYYCKKILFTELSQFASLNGYKSVLDGTNISDLSGHRPGYKAIKEISSVKVPYIELNITKDEIRNMAKELDISTFDKAASACLSSRIPTGHEIVPQDLRVVDTAETFLRCIGFHQVRVRHHEELARIVVTENQIGLVLEKKDEIIEKMKNIGYKHVCLDLTCYGES